MSSYSLLIGQVEAYSLDRHGTRHIELLIRARGKPYRASINIWSKIAPHRLLYGFRPKMCHPMLRPLGQRQEGLYSLDRPSLWDLRQDYRKQGLINRRSMVAMPDHKRGPRNDLLDMVLPKMRDLIARPEAYKLAIFGDAWGPEDRVDWYFDHDPSQGIHNIHMNGGEDPERDWNDGGLFIYNRQAKSWEGHFFAFQGASWS